MADYTAMAFSNIRSYIWAQLQAEEILDADDYWVDKMNTKLNPIIPSQQIPEFQNLLPGVPYIIYDIETVDYGQQFWICEEVATLTIVGDGYLKIYSISELIKDLFRRYDASAYDLNNNLIDKSFRFLKTHVSGILSPDIGAEADNQTASIELTYCYTRNLTGTRYA
jgi:hypothetical protein